MRPRTLAALWLLVLVCNTFVAHAQSERRQIQVLLKNVPGAPTPEEVVSYTNTWPHATNPPLQAFLVKDPVASGYLMEDRATGDFFTWLQANPNSARRKLEDYLLMTFPLVSDVPVALAALLADPYVEEAAEPPAMDFHTAVGGSDAGTVEEPQSGGQYGWDDMALGAAWEITGGGYALIGQVDAGLDTTHPALRQFSGNTYVGGNFIAAASKDVGLTGEPGQSGFNTADVDEAKAEWISAGGCSPVSASLSPDILGHGTHAAGLLVANGGSGAGANGTCKYCGLAAYRAVFLECNSQITPAQVWPTFNDNAADRGKTEAIDSGAQAISMSFGHNYGTPISCVSYRSRSMCLSLAYATARDAALIAS
ncbi:MAG TPA: S8 family serine peptidase, partial [Rhodanobacteraceae bacterium]|nr:S8 family serine peptidase [Rhodanobacteraceae bacterium]